MKVLFIWWVFLGLLTERLLEPGHEEEDCPTTTFFENKGFSIFFCKQTNDIYKFEGCFLKGKVP